MHSAAALISEILTWVGLIAGTPIFIAGLAVRGISRRWVPTDGVIASSGSATVIRWFDGFGDVHEAPGTTHETHQLVPGDDVRVWFHSRKPSRCRTYDPALDGKALRLTGLILLGIGVAAALLGLVLMFV